MASFEGKKDTDKWFPVQLVNSLNLHTPETGVAFGDVTCKYGYEAATSETTYTVTANEWKEQGDGNYWLKIGASEFTSEGKYIVKVEAAVAADYNFVVEVRDKTIAELIDLFTTDRFAEPGQGIPPASATWQERLGYLYKWKRNKCDDDNATIQYYADDASTVDQKRSQSDDGTTYTQDEIVSGP